MVREGLGICVLKSILNVKLSYVKLIKYKYQIKDMLSLSEYFF